MGGLDNSMAITVIGVVGPTATGKSRLGVSLAKHFNGEIVSCDSMQIYQGMPIATAQPTFEEKAGVAHHLLDFLPVDERYSVAQFVTDAKADIETITKKNKLPILVGGTGLYISSLLNGISFSDETYHPKVREKLEDELKCCGPEAMLQKLREIDPEYAKSLHPNNQKRVLRALEQYEYSGITMSEQLINSRRLPSPYHPVVLGLDYKDRQNLYHRINQRVDQMISSGLIEEARRFYQALPEKTAAQAIGIKELKPFFDGETALENCIETIKRETRRYAKRQRTWFLRDPAVQWFYPDEFSAFSDLIDSAVDYVTDRI